MDTMKPLVGRITHAVAVLTLTSSVLVACSADNGNPFAVSMIAAGAQAISNNNIVQGNRARASSALDAANAQTCAAAAPFRQAAQTEFDAATASAQQSQDILAKVQQAADAASAAKTKMSTMKALIERNRSELQELRDGLKIDSTTNVADLVDRAQAFINEDAYRDHTRDILAAADDFRDSIRTDQNLKNLAGFNDGADNIEQLSSDFQTAAEQYNVDRRALHNLTVSLPSNRDIQFSQLSYRHQRRLDSWIWKISTMSDSSDLLSKRDNPWQKIQGWANISIRNAENFVFQQTSVMAKLADQTWVNSAEATRNAWLAVEACGGPLPPNLPALDEPFGIADNPFRSIPNPVPGRNDTFWDISSP
jgi:hypothetical protein